MYVETKITGADHVLETLKQLPPEIVSKRGGPVRSALRKAAVVIQKPAKANLQSVLGHMKNGEQKESTGLLLENVVVTRGKAPSDGKGERYLVRVRRKVYPGRVGPSSGQKATTTLAAAQLLEWGSSQQPAEKWLVPAFVANASKAIQTATDEVVRAVDRVARKYLKK